MVGQVVITLQISPKPDCTAILNAHESVSGIINYLEQATYVLYLANLFINQKHNSMRMSLLGILQQCMATNFGEGMKMVMIMRMVVMMMVLW